MRIPLFRLLPLALALFAFGCGTSDSANLNGNWVAGTSSNTGSQALTINFALQEGNTVGNSTDVTVSGFTFNPTSNNCFPDSSTVNAIATITAAAQSGGSRTMIMDLWSQPNQTGNHATYNLTIDPSNNSATGTYSLIGVTTGCNSDNGTVNLNRA